MYGDTFTFPWKRGPLDTISEYLEAQNQFELTKNHIHDCLNEIDWISDIIHIFNQENELKSVATRTSILRLIISMIRLKKELSERTVEGLISNTIAITTIINSAMSSNDSITQACCL